MIKEQVKITNRLGLHARPAAMIAQEANKFKSDINIAKDDIEVNAKSIMGIMMLAAECGSSLLLSIKGPDQDAAITALKTIFEKIAREDLSPL